jgi:hypothetical protein
MTGKRFATEVDIKQAVTSGLQTYGTDLFYAVINVVEPWRDDAKILKMTVWMSVVYHLLVIFYVHIAVRMSCQLQIACYFILRQISPTCSYL